MATPSSEPNDPNFSNFFTTVARFGLSKPYKFKILDISPFPSGLAFPGGIDSGGLLYFTSLTLPSRKINTATVPYRAFEFAVPTNASYPESQSWSINVLQDENLLFRDFFEKWSERTYNIENNTQVFVNTNLQFAVYEDVIDRADQNIAGVGETKKPSKDGTSSKHVIKRIYTLYGVYPVLVGGIQYSFTDPGTTFASFNVTFAYQYFTAEAKTSTPSTSLPATDPASNLPAPASGSTPSKRKRLNNITR